MAVSFTLGNGLIGNNMFQAKRRKFGVGSLLVLLLIGGVFVVAGWAFYKSTQISPNWKRTNGTVVGSVANNSGSGGTTYAATVSYKVNGQTYRVTSNSSSSSFPQNGSTKQVAYNPQAPSDAKVVGSGSIKLFMLLFMGAGAIMILAAPIAFVKSMRRSEDIGNLTHTGQKVTGVLVDIQQNNGGNGMQRGNGFRANSTNISYRLVVQAADPSGTVGTYLSDWLSGIGGLAMADFRSNPIPLDVYINPANPKDYYVDASEVPSLTPERITQLIQSAAHLGQPTSVPPGATPPIVPSAAPTNSQSNPVPGETPPGGSVPGAMPPAGTPPPAPPQS